MDFDSTALRFSPLGDRALLLELGRAVEPAAIDRVRALADFLREQQFPGILDLVPALCTIGVHYDPQFWLDETGRYSPYELLVGEIRKRLPELDSLSAHDGRLVEVPVCYDEAFGEDLLPLAREKSLSPEQLVEIHCAPIYTVYMLGFAPGFVYLGGLDERLVAPRRDTPRANVAAGSVAIANHYCGIYPAELPGGWHILGRTPLCLFDLSRDPPSRFSAGDRIKFVPVSAVQFGEIENASS